MGQQAPRRVWHISIHHRGSFNPNSWRLNPNSRRLNPNSRRLNPTSRRLNPSSRVVQEERILCTSALPFSARGGSEGLVVFGRFLKIGFREIIPEALFKRVEGLSADTTRFARSIPERRAPVRIIGRTVRSFGRSIRIIGGTIRILGHESEFSDARPAGQGVWCGVAWWCDNSGSHRLYHTH